MRVIDPGTKDKKTLNPSLDYSNGTIGSGIRPKGRFLGQSLSGRIQFFKIKRGLTVHPLEEGTGDKEGILSQA